MIAATILAAGASRRMGCPKALLDYRGRTFLQRILDLLDELGLECIVAIGYDADKVLARHDLHGVVTVENEQLCAGPIGSIRAAIRAIEGRQVQGLLVWPVDLPHVRKGTVRALLERFRRPDQSAIVIPEFEGRGGHPVIFGRQVFDELLGAPDTEGARSVVRRDPERVARIPVRDDAVLWSINTPEAYQRLLRRER